MSAILTGIVLAGAFVALSRVYPGARGLSHATIAALAAFVAAALGLALTLFRRQMLATRINRYLWAAVFAIVVTCLMVHITGALVGAPLPYALLVDLLVSGSVVGTVGLNLHRGLVWVGLVYLLGAALGALFPERVLEAVAGVFFVSHLVVAHTWRSLEDERRADSGENAR